MDAFTGLGAAAQRELKRMGSKPLYVVIMLFLPIFSSLLLWAIFANGVPRDLPIAVCDLDQSSLSRRITSLLDASAGLAVSERVTDPEAGHARMREGKAYALVVLPEDLERNVLAHRAPPVIGYYNNEFLLPGSLVNRDIRAVIESVSTGIELRLKKSWPGGRHVEAGLVEPIRIDQHPLFNPYLNYAYFLMTALLPTMLQIFILVTVVYAVGSELRDGTAKEWLGSAGGRVWPAVLGKTLPYTIVFFSLGLAMVALIFGVLGVPLKGSLKAITAATFIFVAAYEAISLFIVAMTANLRLSLNFAAFFATTAFAFVGITFPTIGLSWLAKTWAAVIPLSYYLQILIDQGIRGVPVQQAVVPFAALATFIPLSLILPVMVLPKYMTQERYWGRS